MPSHVVIPVALLAAAAFAQERKPGYVAYKGHDVPAVFELKAEDGKHGVTIDTKKLDVVLEDLASHARNYPPRFESKNEKELAARDAKTLSDMLHIAVGDEKADVEIDLLLRAGRLEAIAYNLDVNVSAARARGYFERILAKHPDHADGNLHYGMFLGGTADGQKKAIPYLEKALKAGRIEARYGLAMAHLLLKDKRTALMHLRNWVEANPKDDKARALIEAVEQDLAKEAGDDKGK